MTSLEIQGRRSGFSSFVAATTLPLILVGFIATSSAFIWSYTWSPSPSPQIVEQKTDTKANGLLCEGHPSKEPGVSETDSTLEVLEQLTTWIQSKGLDVREPDSALKVIEQFTTWIQ